MKDFIKNEDTQRGAIIIEATLSLTMFMFAILTIYSMFHISLAQARISSALNATAKEISQYAYIYDLTELNDKQSNLAAYGGSAEAELTDMAQVTNLFEAFESISSGVYSIASSPEKSESFLYYLLNEGVEQGKAEITGEIARALMRKHFGSNPDAFLKGLGIEGGMSGLKFHKTRIFTDGNEENVTLNCQYTVTVVDLLDIDMKMNFELCAKTRAWVGS